MCLKKIQSCFQEGSRNWTGPSIAFFEAVIEHLREITSIKSCSQKIEDEIPNGFINLNEFYDQTAICSRNLSSKILNNVMHPSNVAVFRNKRWYVDKDQFAEFIADLWGDYPIAANRAIKFLNNFPA